ncbi:hypothetical protein HOLleu_36216 [Holothuria leucospilota]|uniref:Uncharacterized protein n=1 Tax=Holothuria leucospilota TaxID=206669 RepID=A0A9Q1BFW7_HOLLE|nr:hypothetical protein HOLleu_36216 [Holothuria leucospilota]
MVNKLSMTSRELPAMHQSNTEGNKPRPPNLPLPKIPTCSENSYYSDISEQNHGKISPFFQFNFFLLFREKLF